ncbi:MAG: very short patch repair endonuclease [Nitriliruptorales bacterium]
MTKDAGRGGADWTPPEGSWASSAAIRRTMTSTRGRDTRPERAVRSAVHRLGLRYRVDHPPLPELRRRADMVFPRARVAVFVDGCSWHGCPEHGAVPATNRSYWSDKIARNRERDGDTDTRLLDAGWEPVRVWEHEDPERAAARIARLVRRRSG